jgi:arylsulfatase A-like enzyme
MDLSKEPEKTFEAYGAEARKPGTFAANCLLARRLVERGVRFVQLYHRGWDHHGAESDNDILTALPRLCREVDQGAAALVTDLERRGLLDETLVIWGGEFGRTPMRESRVPGAAGTFVGRDHHARAFSVWMAGGGIRPGITLGRTDDIGYNIVEDPVEVHDLHATLLHLLGVDHTRLTYRFQGRDFRLTDVRGKVVRKLLA